MDLPFGTDVSNTFITPIGLITTRGKHGDNIMACEWTHHISYKPGLVAVSVNPRHASFEQIIASKEFGLGICAADQATLASVAGKESGRLSNKIRILEKLGYSFYPAEHIGVLLVQGTASNMECKLIEQISLGDHTMFVGEVLKAETGGKEPLVYHKGRYWELEKHAPKPSEELREQIHQLFSEHRK